MYQAIVRPMGTGQSFLLASQNHCSKVWEESEKENKISDVGALSHIDFEKEHSIRRSPSSSLCVQQKTQTRSILGRLLLTSSLSTSNFSRPSMQRIRFLRVGDGTTSFCKETWGAIGEITSDWCMVLIEHVPIGSLSQHRIYGPHSGIEEIW